MTHFPEDQDLLGGLVEHKNVRQDPECRRWLLGCRCPAVLAALGRDGRQDEFRDIFCRLATLDATQALQLVDSLPDLARRLLLPNDLFLLFQSSSSEVRLKAITMLGEFFAEPESRDRVSRTLSS